MKGGRQHRPVHLVSGRAKAAAHYPRALCDAFLRGADIQAHAHAELNRLQQFTGMCDMCDVGDLEGLAEKGGLWSEEGAAACQAG